MENVKSVEDVFSMKGGSGDSSYVNNSSVQLNMIQAFKPLLEHSIYQNVRSVPGMTGADHNVFRIVDLGCSTGMNTLLAVDTIVKAVELTFIRHCMNVPEFHVYFSDLPSNDFNTLLRMLPPFKAANRMVAAERDDDKPAATRSYFASAVAGSQYRRLFPRQSLHFCHSSNSLHWLSGVPASVVDRNSAAWNGGHVYISSDAVGLAYLKQFRQDFGSFLEARAHEMVPGGCMFIALLARSSGDIKEQGIMGGFAGQLEGALEELMKEGLIEDGKLNSINLPIYCPTVEELQSIVETEQSFKIESMRFLRFPSHPFTEVREGEEGMIAKILENYYKSMFESIVGSHFGWDERLVDVIFARIASRVTGKSRDFLRNTSDVAVAFLVRKTD